MLTRFLSVRNEYSLSAAGHIVLKTSIRLQIILELFLSEIRHNNIR